MAGVTLPASLAALAAGHGWMTEPPSRTGAMMEGAGSQPYGASLWFNQGCTIGCPECGGVEGSETCGSQQGQETLPHTLRTWNLDSKTCGVHPWCAPGSAPVMNPCGIAGGDKHQGKAGNGGDVPPGYNFGDQGTEMRDGAAGYNRVWRVGDVVDVAWSIDANHGGGYQYRLCPKGAEQSELCFQTTPLEFVGNEQYIQYCDMSALDHGVAGAIYHRPLVTPDGFNGTQKVPISQMYPKPCDRANRTAIPALRVSTGTIPAGSTWTRNPIPACRAAAGGAFNMGCHVSTIPGKYEAPSASAYMFPPPGEDAGRPGILLGGFGLGACLGCNQDVNPASCDKFGKFGPNNCTADETDAQLFDFNIVDKVRVPQVSPGEYVVSFRWDSEQTAQVWGQCAGVTIVAEEVVA